MVFLVGPAPFYRRMVWLLPLVSSNVIVTCLVPSPPVGWGLWLAPPRLCGAVCSTKICMVWLLPLVSSNVIVTCSLPYKIALFSLQTVPLSRFVPVVRDRWEQGRFGGTGAGGRERGWEPGTREHIYTSQCCRSFLVLVIMVGCCFLLIMSFLNETVYDYCYGDGSPTLAPSAPLLPLPCLPPLLRALSLSPSLFLSLSFSLALTPSSLTPSS